jgi:hypothetical protein
MGYLFFGAPNDRPTAQPERDFYIYFIPPFEKRKVHGQQPADEVFFRLKGLDEEIKRHLSSYAAALELASTASGGAKAIYMSKSQDFLKAMSKWLQEKQMTAFEVTYQGKTKTLQDWSKGVSLRDRARLGPDERINFRDVVNITSGLALGQHFQDLAPEYPTFSVLFTEATASNWWAMHCAHWPVATAPRMLCQCWMHWNCWMATALNPPNPATPKKC